MFRNKGLLKHYSLKRYLKNMCATSLTKRNLLRSSLVTINLEENCLNFLPFDDRYLCENLLLQSTKALGISSFRFLTPVGSMIQLS